MQSKATTVKEYVASLPDDRRAAIESVRKVILANLDKDFEEGMQYGMIGYYVPHRVFPAGYHCDPKQPLPFAGLASQKGYMSLYLLSMYLSPEITLWFHQEWEKSGKKLDMGKSCIRFKKLDDLPLDIIGKLVKKSTVPAYIAMYTTNLAKGGGMSAAKKPSKTATKATTKTTTKKATKKTTTKAARPTAKKASKKR